MPRFSICLGQPSVWPFVISIGYTKHCHCHWLRQATFRKIFGFLKTLLIKIHWILTLDKNQTFWELYYKNFKRSLSTVPLIVFELFKSEQNRTSSPSSPSPYITICIEYRICNIYNNIEEILLYASDCANLPVSVESLKTKNLERPSIILVIGNGIGDWERLYT